jgi:RecA/RadA recombinase
MAENKGSKKSGGAEMEAKLNAAHAAMQQIKDMYGDGAIMKFGEAQNSDVDTVPTGCLSLDLALGVGGVPRGRIIEIFGPEASGKTTLSQHIIAEVQKLGGSLPLLMPSTLSIQIMLARSVSMSKRC